jgi:predicted nucleic acid-binding protein
MIAPWTKWWQIYVNPDDFDLLIAAAAQARGLVLVTDNLKHFQRIENLAVENWVKR